MAKPPEVAPAPVGFLSIPHQGFSTHQRPVTYGAHQPPQGFAAGMKPKASRAPDATPKEKNPHAAEKQARRKLRAQNREPSGIWPPSHVIRPIKREKDWGTFLSDLDKGTEGTGTVAAIGELCIEYISAKELEVMFDKKYTETMQTKDTGRARRNVLAAMSELSSFVDKMLGDTTAAAHLHRLEEPLFPALEKIWEPGKFPINTLDITGPNEISLVFDREPRRTFNEEWRTILRFVGSKSGLGLDVSGVDHQRELAVPVLTTYLPASEVADLEIPTMPLLMEARPPQMSFIDALD